MSATNRGALVDSGFDIGIAWNCLELSGLAYEDFLQPRLVHLGFTLIATYDVKGTQGFLAEKDGVLYLAIRGSQEFRDFFNDVRYVKTDFPGGGRVQIGFLDAFKVIAPLVRKDLKKPHQRGKRLFATGHSLGAAVAQEAALSFKADAAYVFGSPRVGNEEWAERLDAQCPVYRFENSPDPVTWVPYATSPLQAFMSWREDRPVTVYEHAGFEIKLPGRWHRFNIRYRQSFSKWEESWIAG